MNHLKGSPNTGLSAGSLPMLPVQFWQMAREVTRAWEGMLGILEKEWKALQNGRTDQLWKVTEEKKRHFRLIEDKEKRIFSVVDHILEKLKAPSGKDRWNSLRRAVTMPDRAKLEEWLSDINLKRKEAIERNRRHHDWIEEQLEMTRRLSSLLRGDNLEKPVTYDQSGSVSPNIYTNRHRLEVG